MEMPLRSPMFGFSALFLPPSSPGKAPASAGAPNWPAAATGVMPSLRKRRSWFLKAMTICLCWRKAEPSLSNVSSVPKPIAAAMTRSVLLGRIGSLTNGLSATYFSPL